MARKRIKVSGRMLFTWFMLAGLIFLFAPQTLTNKIQFTFAHIFRWPLSISRSISLSARLQPLTDVVSRRQYNKLQNHLANITEQLYQQQQEAERRSGLRKRFGLDGAILITADVIRSSINGPENVLIINRGENDGLAVGQFVLGINNIIGTISAVSSRTSSVKLVTDSTSTMAVKISDPASNTTTRKAGVKAVMNGLGNNTAKIKLLPKKYKIEIGDIVYACKKPSLLDTAMIIGKVAKCRPDDQNPLLWDIIVVPACRIETLNAVDVIIMNPAE